MLDAERDYNDAKQLADKARTKAQEAKRESLSVYTESDSIRVSRVNIDNLDSDSNQIKNEVTTKTVSKYFVLSDFLFIVLMKLYSTNFFS